MNHRDERLGSAPLGKLMFSLALPSVAAQLINVLYNIVDRIFMGSFVGNHALGAIAVTSPLISVMAALSLLITIGGSALFSMNLGKKTMRQQTKCLPT
mgnify:CR=1 FL=1